MLRKLNNSEENKRRLLTESKEMNLTREMRESSDDSETSKFRTFVARIMAVQDKLEEGKQGNRYRRDKIMEAEEIPEI